MKVVHVSAYFAPAFGFGGPPRSLLALCRAQQDAGLDVEVFTTTANRGAELPARPDGELVEGIPVRRFPLGWPRAWLGGRSMAGPLASSAHAADVVHLHGLFNRTIWMAGSVMRGASVPYVLSPRGMLEPPALAHHRWRKHAAFLARDRGILARAARWHATSPGEAETLRARSGARPVVEIPNSVEISDAGGEARRSARLAAGGGDGRPFILFLGRIHPIKRLDLLADAFRRVAEMRPDLDLVIAGPDESGHRARLAPRFAPLGTRVHWVGSVDGMVKAGLLAEARALVLCSDSESFGMSVAEALAAGTPAVVTRTCPWPSIAQAGAGFWVEQDGAAIADALRQLVADETLAAAMGRQGRALVAAEFSATAVARRWVSLYASLNG